MKRGGALRARVGGSDAVGRQLSARKGNSLGGAERKDVASEKEGEVDRKEIRSQNERER